MATNLILQFLLISIIVIPAVGNDLSDHELARRDSIWYSQNPGQLPQWETLEERRRRGASDYNEFENLTKSYRNTQPAGEIRNIAEFETLEGVLIAYSSTTGTSGSFGLSGDVIKELASGTKVYCKVAERFQDAAQRELQNSGVPLDSVIFINANADSYWTRDYGPWWIMNKTSLTVSVIDFIYNRDRPNDDVTPKNVADNLNVSLFSMPLKHCGGNYMSDGGGNAASTELVVEENSPKTADSIKAIANRYLGINRYHITMDPLGDYIKHIDCWGKFLGPDRVIIGKVPGVKNRDYDSVAAYFSRQISAWGIPYKVFRVYSGNGEPYTNSFILNGTVLVPIKGNSANDAPALESYRKAMPGYKVIGCTGTWESTDALHCRTKEIPDRKMLFINHKPLHDTVTSSLPGVAISTEIIPFSKTPIVGDSTLLFYKFKSGDAYISAPLLKTIGNIYSCTIPTNNNNTQVYYYIQAKDASGRKEHHPWIGAPDPHTFFARLDKSANWTNNLLVNTTHSLSFDAKLTSGSIMITYHLPTTASSAVIRIFDISGKVVFRKQLEDRDGLLNLQHGTFPAGIYCCTINCGAQLVSCLLRAGN